VCLRSLSHLFRFRPVDNADLAGVVLALFHDFDVDTAVVLAASFAPGKAAAPPQASFNRVKGDRAPAWKRHAGKAKPVGWRGKKRKVSAANNRLATITVTIFQTDVRDVRLRPLSFSSCCMMTMTSLTRAWQRGHHELSFHRVFSMLFQVGRARCACALRRFDSAIRARPSAVFGPVLRPPWSRQRVLNGTARARQA